MLADSDLPLFSGRPIEPTPRPRDPVGVSSAVAARRRKAKADRIRAGKDRPIIAPGLNAEGETIFVGVVPVVTFADEWRAFMVEHPDALAAIVRVAHEHAAAKLGRLSIAKVWEDCRGKVGVELNNNLRAPAARHLMATYRALAGRFAVRDAAGDSTRRTK